jgi:glycosyltransferase involved in cell wall biosynthesis
VTRISAVIITLNEEDRLPVALDALRWCDEVLVVDAGSTDDTRGVCARYANCRFLERPFDGYGPQKRFAVARAAHDWVLSVDADEVLDAEAQAAIRERLEVGAGDCAGFRIRRPLVFFGRVFRRGRQGRERVLRLFDRRRGTFTDALVHERVEVDGRIGDLAGCLLHYSYRDLDDYFRKFNAYTSLMAQQMYSAGRRTSGAQIAVRPFWGFLQTYLLHGNWRNGFAGFVWSLLGAGYRTVKYIKLMELQRRPAPQKTRPRDEEEHGANHAG